MKIQSANSNIFEIGPLKSGENPMPCPECSASRKKNKAKSFSWNKEKNQGYCNHCGVRFFEYRPFEQKNYTVPEWKNITNLTDKAVKWFTGRMISQDVLKRMKIYSDTEWMPQKESECSVICFPYFKDDKLINIKYRTGDKQFKFVSGAELIFYNIDAISSDEVIITEGEIDCLSFIQAGYNNVVSVPNGAGSKSNYLDDYIYLFENVTTIFIATDQDTKGIELRDELARRLGQNRCRIVSFKDCKDANEYLCKYTAEFKDCIDKAKLYPIKGIIRIEDIYQDTLRLYENGVQPGMKIEVGEIDKYITWETGRMAVVTGIPGSGKSEFVDYVVARLNLLYGWKYAYFTPENYPLKFHYAKMFEKYIGKKFSKTKTDSIEFDMAHEYMKANMTYILDPEDYTVETIINAAKGLIKSDGIKILIVDPYNKLDHKYTDSETQYISRFLDKLTALARYNDILIFLVAHPRKMHNDENGNPAKPTLYDISGSAHFYNKTDYGFTVHRLFNNDGVMTNRVNVYWQKIKFKHLGMQGISHLMYNYNNGRFDVQDDVNNWDNSNWLVNRDNPFLI